MSDTARARRLGGDNRSLTMARSDMGLRISQSYEGFGSGGDGAEVSRAMRDAARLAAQRLGYDLDVEIVYGVPDVLTVSGGDNKSRSAVHNEAYAAGEVAYANR